MPHVAAGRVRAPLGQPAEPPGEKEEGPLSPDEQSQGPDSSSVLEDEPGSTWPARPDWLSPDRNRLREEIEKETSSNMWGSITANETVLENDEFEREYREAHNAILAVMRLAIYNSVVTGNGFDKSAQAYTKDYFDLGRESDNAIAIGSQILVVETFPGDRHLCYRYRPEFRWTQRRSV